MHCNNCTETEMIPLASYSSMFSTVPLALCNIFSLSQHPEKVSMSMLLFWKLMLMYFSHTHNASPFHGPAQAHGYQEKTHFLPHSCTHSKNNQHTFNGTTPAVLVTLTQPQFCQLCPLRKIIHPTVSSKTSSGLLKKEKQEEHTFEWLVMFASKWWLCHWETQCG